MSNRYVRFICASTAAVLLTACDRDVTAPTLAAARAPTAMAVTGSWAQHADVPDPRNGRAGAVVNGRLYGFGGALDADCAYTTSGYAYDPATNSWSATANMRVSRSEAVGVALNDRIHVLGGNPGCGAATGAHEVYDPSTNDWSLETPMTARYGARGAVVGGKIYVIGGFVAGQMLNLVEEFDPATHQWTTKAPMPTARGGGAIGVLNGLIYVLGGCCGGASTDNAFEVYDPATNSWTRKTALPFLQSASIAAGINGRLYVFGSGNSGEFVKRYDPQTDTWDDDAPMPVPLTSHFGGLIGDAFYIAAGHSLGHRQNDTWAFTFTGGVHDADNTPPAIQVPADIAAEAVEASGATVTYAVTATDDVGVVAQSCEPASSSVFPIGTTVVTCSASDAAGNSTSATFRVTITDTTPPVFGDAPDLSADASSTAGATVGYSVTATDIVGVASVSCTPASGSTFAMGTTTVQCVAADAAGNSATIAFTVTVSDRAAPVFGALAAVTINATSPSGTSVTYDPAVTDNVGVAATSCQPRSGDVFPVGTTTVTCTASDAAGNTATASFTVRVVGAAEQMAAFDAAVVDLVIHEGTETSLRAKLDAASASLARGDIVTACNQLEAMINQIHAQTGKKIAAHEAGVLLADIDRIKRATGC